MTSILFLDPLLSLINIPLQLFPHFIYSILQVIQHPPEFFNISLTPTSLSIICPQETTADLFLPLLQQLRPETGATIENEEYVCMQIDGPGMGDGSRLLELTQPLAKAGVSILFITTYFSDYVLVAARQMKKVRKVLLEGGFSFQDLSNSFISSAQPVSNSISNLNGFTRGRSRSNSHVQFEYDSDEEDDQDDSEIEQSMESITNRVAHEQGTNTLNFLRMGKIPVRIAKSTKLLMLGSRVPFSDYTIPLTRIFLRRDLPDFFSLTKAPETSPSMLLTEDLAKLFEPDTLLGLQSAEVLIPIMLDLSSLESAGRGGLSGCGIVCGVVDELMQRALKPSPASMEQMLSKEELVMSYLSTVVTGNVLIREQDLQRIGPINGDCNVM